MLSAVAARKAAAERVEDRTDDAPLSPPPSQTPTSTPTTPPTPIKKRKQPDPPPIRDQSGKKRKPSAPRYYVQCTAPPVENSLVEDTPIVNVASRPSITASQPVVARRKRAFSPSRPYSDSSDDDAENPLGEAATAPSTELVTQSRPKFYPSMGQNVLFIDPDAELIELDLRTPSVMLIMQAQESFSMIGVAHVTILQGSLLLDGVLLPPSRTAHQVFAPSCSPIPYITAVHSSMPSITTLPARVVDCTSPGDTVILISELHTGIESLCNLCPDFDDIFSMHEGDSVDIGLRGVCLIDEMPRRMQGFMLSRSWEDALASLAPSTSAQDLEGDHSEPRVILVKGPKQVGKSTFARTILNRLSLRYKRVAFLECDLGQSEFTPAAMVALHVIDRPLFGPPFSHPRPPFLAHFIGSTNPRSNPTHYMSCIQSLLQDYLLDTQHSSTATESHTLDFGDRIDDQVPLVINTHGWNKSLGADLTRKILDLISVTDIVDFGDAAANDIAESVSLRDSLFTGSNMDGPRMHYASSVDAGVLSSLYTAAGFRSLNIMSYFHSRYYEELGGALWIAEPLCAQPPWEVEWRNAVDALILHCTGGNDVPHDEVHQAINSSIVGMVSADPGGFERMTCDPPYVQGGMAPSSSESRCLGLGIVRFAASTSPVFHLLSPVDPALLSKCRVLVKGELELPVWSMLDYLHTGRGVADVSRDNVPFLQWGAGNAAAGAEKRRVRRNLMRWGQQ